MPPIVALLLCTAFVLLLLVVERRASRGVSGSLWIPTLWMLMIASRSLGGWFGVSGGNDSGNWMDQVALSSLTIASVVVIVQRRIDWSGILRRNQWLLALIAYMLVSVFWSEIPFIAIKRWIREAIIVVMALVTVSEADPRQALASLFRRCAYVLLPFSLVLNKYYPLLGRQYGRWSGIEMWTGVTSQKNQLGLLCMISIFFLGWALYQHWRERHKGAHYQVWADVFIVLLAMYLLHGANSATSLGSLILGAAIYAGLRWFRKLRPKVPQFALIALVLFLIAYGASAPFLGGSNVAEFSSSLDRDVTLTGRTHVWAVLLPAHKRQPLLGYGIGSFWTDARRELYGVPTAHNGYLDILLELGQLGLAFYAIWLLSLARQLHRALLHDYDWASLAICVLLMGLVYNVTESALNSLTEYMTSALILASLVVIYKPVLASKRIKSHNAVVCNTATSVGRAADRQTPDRWYELTRNS